MSENQTPAPISTEVTPKQRAEEIYGLGVKISNLCKTRFRGAPAQTLEETLGAYLQLVQKPIPQVAEGEDPPTMEVSLEILQQMALLASSSLTRIIVDKYKGIRA